MKFQEIALAAYEHIWKDISDAFDNIHWQENSWGKTLTWDNIEEDTFLDLNMGIISDNATADDLKASENWLSQQSGRKLYLIRTDKNNNFGKDVKKFQNIYLRRPGKIGYPLLTYETIRNISYLEKNIDVNIRSLLSILNKFYDTSEGLKDAFDKYAGALMLLQNGRIWLIEHDQGNIMSMAITITFEASFSPNLENPITLIYFLATQPQLRKMGNAQLLLQIIIHKYSTHNILIKSDGTDQTNHMMKKHDFEKILQFSIIS